MLAIPWQISNSKVCDKCSNSGLGGAFEDYGSLEISSCLDAEQLDNWKKPYRYSLLGIASCSMIWSKLAHANFTVPVRPRVVAIPQVTIRDVPKNPSIH